MITVDNTMLDDADTCGRLYYFRHIRNLVPHRVNIAAQFGICLHNGMYVYKKTKDLVAACIAFEESWKPFDGTDDLRTNDKGLELLAAFDARYKTDEQWVSIQPEVYFSLPLTDNITYCGIIDDFGKYLGEFGICDLKTTAMPSSLCTFPNNQIIGYCWAGATLFGEHFSRAVFDVMDIKKSSKGGFYRRKDGTTADCIIRKPIDISDSDIHDFAEDVVSKCVRIQHWLDTKHFPKQTKSCQGKFGLCAYHPICAVQPEAQEWAVGQFYRVETWEPGRGGKQE